ncbi:transcriptional regulator [Solibacillus sp. CAU 1738]|uniref:transcriptional regulator n=1 Tax=Solibacillus sp. CAU 1738 TaxID=3140363 RepID=UPI003260911B
MNEVVSYSSELLIEFQQTFDQRSFRDGEMSYVSKRKIVKHAQPNQIREALIKGYVEMSHINLSICSECLYAEYEAEHMVERLVSGR